MFKIQMKLLAVLLSITLVLTCFPMVASASGISKTEITEEAIVETSNTEISKSGTEPSILSELIDKRESNIKHFKMSDGSYTAAVYPYDVHFKNSNGEFLDIDNKL